MKAVPAGVFYFHSITMYQNSLISTEFILRAGINQKEKMFEENLDPSFRRERF